MKIKINYLENIIKLKDNNVLTIEIENKKYFYRLVNDLNSLSNSEIVEEITFYNDEDKEINGKVKIFVNYFDFEFNSKKYSNDINKYIINEMNESDKNNLIKSYNKLIDAFLKILKLSISSKNSLLDNLLLLIELENVLKSFNTLIFINLKQYLTNQELIELYKYSIYNKVNIILIDSQCYGCTLDYENKLIIDSNLDEFLL